MSDILGMIAHGVETFRFKPDDYLTCAKHVKEIVEENEIETIVLGLPKHMNGDIGERGQISIEFKKQLEEMIGKLLQLIPILQEFQLEIVHLHQRIQFMHSIMDVFHVLLIEIERVL